MLKTKTNMNTIKELTSKALLYVCSLASLTLGIFYVYTLLENSDLPKFAVVGLIIVASIFLTGLEHWKIDFLTTLKSLKLNADNLGRIIFICVSLLVMFFISVGITGLGGVAFNERIIKHNATIETIPTTQFTYYNEDLLTSLGEAKTAILESPVDKYETIVYVDSLPVKVNKISSRSQKLKLNQINEISAQITALTEEKAELRRLHLEETQTIEEQNENIIAENKLKHEKNSMYLNFISLVFDTLLIIMVFYSSVRLSVVGISVSDHNTVVSTYEQRIKELTAQLNSMRSEEIIKGVNFHDKRVTYQEAKAYILDYAQKNVGQDTDAGKIAANIFKATPSSQKKLTKMIEVARYRLGGVNGRGSNLIMMDENNGLPSMFEGYSKSDLGYHSLQLTKLTNGDINKR